MEHLIDKDALVAEMERRIKEYQSTGDDYWFPVIENLKNILSFIDTLEVKETQEEPISKDLEEAAKNHAVERYRTTRSEALADKCKWSFITGAKWKKEQLIGKACEWLKSYRQDTPDGTGYIAGIVNDKTIEDFKKAMEE